jgi:hypothetical protein
MPMTSAEFKQLKDIMMRGASSAMDPNAQAEALQCFRRATLLIANHGHTWAQALDKVIRVVDPVMALDDSNKPPRRIQIEEDEEWEQLFDDAVRGASGTFLDRINDIYDKWKEYGRMTERQKEVIRNAANRWADRHEGGRVK